SRRRYGCPSPRARPRRCSACRYNTRAMTGRATPAWRSPSSPVLVGISSCLLGEEVRFDGGHKRDSYITGVLGRHFAWVPTCPDMEIGLGTPRETLRLVGDPAAPR